METDKIFIASACFVLAAILILAALVYSNW
jgi:hypothetical protein